MSIVPEGSVMVGMQLPIQTLTRTLREDWEDTATVDDLVTVAKACDDAGFGFVGVCDHIGLPLNDYTKHMTPTWYDPISTLGFLAAHTDRVKLLTIVYIAAYRHPLVGAKSFLTLDHLSGYEGARPVRIGNGAWDQKQHDVWGMLMDSVVIHGRRIGQQVPGGGWELLPRLERRGSAVDASCSMGAARRPAAESTPGCRGTSTRVTPSSSASAQACSAPPPPSGRGGVIGHA